MTKRIVSRASALVLSGLLAVAPIAGAIAIAPTAAADSSISAGQANLPQILVADVEETINPDDLVIDHGTIENPDGEDIVPLDADLNLPEPVEEVEQVVEAPVAAAERVRAWPIIGSLLGGLLLGGLLTHFIHKRKYLQYEARI